MDKKTFKQLKRPDFLQEAFFAGLDWVKSRRIAALAIAAVCVLLVAAAGAWHYYAQWRSDERKTELLAIDHVFEQEEDSFAKADKNMRDTITALEKKLADTKDEKAKASLDTELAEKNRQIETFSPNHSASQVQYLEFFHKHVAKPEGWRAGLFAAKIFLEDRKQAEAVDILAKLLTQSLGVDFYQVQVRLMYISVLEDLKRYEEALLEADKLLGIASEEFKPRTLFAKGRLQFFSGMKEEAAQTFDLIISSHSASPEARQAQAVKALL